MPDNIFSGNEHFLNGPKKTTKISKKQVIGTAIFIIALIIILIVSLNKEATENTPPKIMTQDDLKEYRNLTAQELLDQLNKEKGFDKNPEAEIERPRYVRNFTMNATSFYFEPNKIQANLDDKIIITITADDTNHSIRIPSFFVERDLIKDQPEVIEIIASKLGEFTFYSLDDDNMKGKIIITNSE